MASDSMKTLRLLLCITGLLNGHGNISSNESDSSYHGGQGLTPLRPVSNGTGSGSRNTGTTWLRELIKTRLVKCRRRPSFLAGENRRGPARRLEVRGLGNKTGLVPTICVFGIVGNLLTVVVLTCARFRAGASAERKVKREIRTCTVTKTTRFAPVLLNTCYPAASSER